MNVNLLVAIHDGYQTMFIIIECRYIFKDALNFLIANGHRIFHIDLVSFHRTNINGFALKFGQRLIYIRMRQGFKYFH